MAQMISHDNDERPFMLKLGDLWNGYLRSLLGRSNGLQDALSDAVEAFIDKSPLLADVKGGRKAQKRLRAKLSEEERLVEACSVLNTKSIAVITWGNLVAPLLGEAASRVYGKEMALALRATRGDKLALKILNETSIP